MLRFCASCHYIEHVLTSVLQNYWGALGLLGTSGTVLLGSPFCSALNTPPAKAAGTPLLAGWNPLELDCTGSRWHGSHRRAAIHSPLKTS